MQERESLSPQKQLTVEQLLRLKRLENPGPDFWAGFERELQQKQLQALVRPSAWARLRATLLAPRHSLAGLVAVTAGCAAALVAAVSLLIVLDENPAGGAATNVGREQANVTHEDWPEMLASVEARETGKVHQADSFFVVDALRPDETAPESFRTVAVPETLVGASDDSAYYVVNVFRTTPEQMTGEETGLDF